MNHQAARKTLATVLQAMLNREGTPTELQAIQAISLHETGSYGDGTYRNAAPLVGTDAYGGVYDEDKKTWSTLTNTPGVLSVTGTNNWGSIQSLVKLPADNVSAVEISDSSPRLAGKNGNHAGWYQVALKKYPTPEAGAAAYLSTLLRKNGSGARPVLDAAGRGGAVDIARAMRGESYFEGVSTDQEKTIANYGVGTPPGTGGIYGAAVRIAKALGEPLYVTMADKPGGSGPPSNKSPPDPPPDPTGGPGVPTMFGGLIFTAGCFFGARALARRFA